MHKPVQLRDDTRGFTLIELLVVIAIIAVLISLLLPGRAIGPRGRPSGSVRQQPEAAGPGSAQLRVGQRYVSRWGISRPGRDWQSLKLISPELRPLRGLDGFLRTGSHLQCAEHQRDALRVSQQHGQRRRIEHPVVSKRRGHRRSSLSRRPDRWLGLLTDSDDIQQLRRQPGSPHLLLGRPSASSHDARNVCPLTAAPAIGGARQFPAGPDRLDHGRHKQHHHLW